MPESIIPEKLCPTCQKHKPRNSFHKNRSRYDGLNAQCKECRNTIARSRMDYRPMKRQHSRRYWKKNSVQLTLKRRCRVFGLTTEQLSNLLTAQNNTCAICSREPDPLKRSSLLAIDHDHETGNVRGLLCISCNAALGMLGDNIEGLERALSYLLKASEV